MRRIKPLITANNSENIIERMPNSKLLDGFTGKLTTSKWAKTNKCSQETALREFVPSRRGHYIQS